MKEFIMTLLSLSFSGTILFFVLYCLSPFYRNKLSRRWQYYIWLVAVLRFLLPFTAESTVTGHLFREVEQVIEKNGREAEADGNEGNDISVRYVTDVSGAEDAKMEIGGQADGDVTISGIQGERTSSPDMQTDAIPNSAMQSDTSSDIQTDTASDSAMQNNNASSPVSTYDKPDSPYMRGVFACLVILWAAAAWMLFVRKVTVYQSYLRFLKSGNEEISDIEILNLLAKKEEAMKLKKPIGLYRNPLLTSPIMTGFFRPRIIIPAKKTSMEELSYIFEHELTHYKYFDLFYKWLVQITLCIHWFNPFVYLLAKEVNKRCELACDERVVDSLEKQERKAYGDTLLAFLETEQSCRSTLASIMLTEGAGQLIERLGAIVDYRKKSKGMKIMAAALTLLLCIFSASLGAYAKQSETVGGKQEEVSRNYPMTGTEGEEKGAQSEQTKLVSVEKDSLSTDDNSRNTGDKIDGIPSENEGSISNYRIVQEKNIYYIFTEGTDEKDKPSVYVSDGSIGITLVKQDGYHTLGPFFEEDFLEETLEQCHYAVEKKYLSPEEEAVILEAAKKIEDYGFSLPDTEPVPAVVTNREEVEIPEEILEEILNEEETDNRTAVVYTQNGYYEEPYIVEIGWNLTKKAAASYPDRRELALEDGSSMTVYFAEAAKGFMSDADAMETVGTVISRVKKKAAEGRWKKWNMPTIETPYVANIIYLPREKISDYLKKAWQESDIASFAFVFDQLGQEEKAAYREKAYEEERIDFFSLMINEMDGNTLADYGNRAYDEGRIDFFSLLLSDMLEMDIMDEEAAAGYVKRAYDEERIDFFSVLISNIWEMDAMDENIIAVYMKKAYEDGRVDFLSILADYLSKAERQRYMRKALQDGKEAVYNILADW